MTSGIACVFPLCLGRGTPSALPRTASTSSPLGIHILTAGRHADFTHQGVEGVALMAYITETSSSCVCAGLEEYFEVAEIMRND